MKKIVLLLDVGDSRFLVMKKNTICELPMIDSNNLTNVAEKINRKYKINIKKDVVIIEQGEDYYFAKCIVDMDIKYDKKIFEAKVVNEIIQDVSNEFHQRLLLNLSNKIYLEIINDAFWLEVVTKTHDKMSDNIMKQLLFDFLAQFSSSFCNEVLIYKYGKESEKNKKTISKELREMRKTYFKVCPTDDSDHMKTILNDMEISFDNKDFNICLFFYNGVLIDINSRTWETNKKYDEYCHIILSPVNWINNLNMIELKNLEPLKAMMTYQFEEMLDKCNSSCKTYSIDRLFTNNLSKNEKIYIMQRIGLLKTVMFFSEKFSSGLQFSNGVIDSKKFLLKVKASLICILGDIDMKKIHFLNEMFDEHLNDIPDEFYSINRKCRNNIHYGFYNELTKYDIEILNKYQDIYLKYVLNEFETKLTLNFGAKYNFDLALAKVKYLVSHKNMS